MHKPEVESARIAAIVLAAGRSRRMGVCNKLCCAIAGVPMVRRVIDAAVGSACVQIVAVTGHDDRSVVAVLQDARISLVHNAGFSEGLASSIHCGLRALDPEIDAALIVHGDMPYLTSAHLDRILAAFDPAAPGIVAPVRAGRRGNPVLWPRRYFGDLLTLHGDQGGRRLTEQYAADIVPVEIEDDAIFADIDTPAELARVVGDSA